MNPKIIQLAEKKLVGKSLSMSLVQNKTAQLWGAFGPHIKDIPHRVSSDKISMQIYPPNYYSAFNPATEFEKWATVEVSTFDDIPTELFTFTLASGLYVVFHYKGSSADPAIFQYIFSEWIPRSEYEIDDRPHFEVLGEKYRNNHPESEEEIWVPICRLIQ